MTEPTHRLTYAARTHPGLIRGNNEDSFFAGDHVMVVADGMGGHAAGEVASKLVVDAVAPLESDQGDPDPMIALRDAVRAGNRAIAELVADHPHLDGMGTTVSALLFTGGRVAMAHVGDSRIYLFRSGVLHQLTHDDTFVQSLVDEGRITEAQAHEHPQRNLVLRALTGQQVDPMLTSRDLEVGDRFLLCSDGLCGVVDAETIADALSHPDPQITVDTLIQLALTAGGPDNVTVIVADVHGIGEAIPPPAVDEDPQSTNPILRLTREMPRVPLPPIPEEPGDRGDDIYDGSYDEDPSEQDEDLPEEAPRSRMRRWGLRALVTGAVLAVLAGLITAGTIWVRTQYYVAEQGNVVVIFRGVDGSVLGWRLSTFEETSCAGVIDCIPLQVSDLQPAAQNQIRSGIKAGSLDDARAIVARLEEQLLPPCPELESDRGAENDTGTDDTGTDDTGADDATDPGSAAGAAPRLLNLSRPAIPGVTCRTVR